MFTKKFENLFVDGKCTQDKIRIQNIKLSSKVIVHTNQIAFVVAKNKPLDRFGEGNFVLEGGIIPKTYKICNLDKPKKSRISKKQYYPKNFKGTILFINLQKYYNMPYSTRNILLFDRLADFKFKLKGVYTFEIIDIDLFAKFITKFLKGNDFIMSKINNYVSKKIRYEFHKEEFRIENFLMKNDEIFDKIIDKLNKKLSKIGIKANDLVINEFIVNKRNNNKINDFISDGEIKISYTNYTKNNEGDEYVNIE